MPSKAQQMQETVVPVALKTSPPVAVSALTLLGVPLQEWVYIVTIVFVLLQSAKLVYDWWKGRGK